MTADTPNEALGRLLTHLSWSPERLAREICRILGTGTLHPSGPYKWLKGHQPRRGEVRQTAAFVLSQALGKPVAVRDLWPQCAAGTDSQLIPATEGMALPSQAP